MTTYAGYTAEALRALAEGAPQEIEVHDVRLGAWLVPGPAEEFYDAAHAALPALLDEVARLRGALKALADDHEQFLIGEYNTADGSDTLRAARAALEAPDGH